MVTMAHCVVAVAVAIAVDHGVMPFDSFVWLIVVLLRSIVCMLLDSVAVAIAVVVVHAWLLLVLVLLLLFFERGDLVYFLDLLICS
jgi:hypothetical protein